MTSMSNIVHIYFRSSAELFVVPVATHTYSGTEPSPIKGLAMTNKRGRSLSSTDDTPLTKRAQNSETSPNTGDHQLHLQSNATSDAPVLATAVHTESIMTESSNPIVGAPAVTIEAQEDAQQEVEAMGSEVSTVLEGNENLMPTVGLMVVAPELNVVYDSWEAFDTELKGYAKATYQLYVIRSTTSVKRRNLKIAESAARGDTTASHAALLGKGFELGGADVNVEQAAERTLIPERFQWYSKSLKCTHGWKDRHRGTGKRGSGVVRSTSCPAKMCVTLQHRGTGPDGWKVVVTKHVRTHNHQLSKELYMYYTENRRIYDPELLAVVGDGSAAATGTAASSNTLVNAHLPSLIDQANQRAGLFRILTSSEDAAAQNQQQASSMAFIVAESAASSPSVSNGTTHHQLVALSEASSGNFIIRPRTRTGAPLAAMPPLGTMVLTPGTIPSKAMDGGGFCVPRVSVKVHPSWDAFHDYVAQYSFDTAQVFRTRSTVSVAARNSKILASVATKAGPDGHDVTSYASFAAASPTSRLIPEEHKWFSKLLICTYGWKRRTRSKGSRLAGEHGEAGPCPAMLLARMERNVDGEWNVVINRHVQEHNHRLNGHVEETDGRSHEAIASTGDTARALVTAPSLDSTPAQPYQSADPAVEMECETIATETSAENMAASPAEHREIVVRVPKLESVFNSWDDFHASLKSYSDSTYQLYRTRTTSSAKGRNRKISQMKRGGNDENDGDSISDPDSSGANGARKIPESWRWYSKTLTCAHGWKERNRGTGKRSAHGVRSTACPVKICATVQFMNPTARLEIDNGSGESNSDSSNNCWRVVVTKHVVDHNHNLSRELYQHYCENRRIYDPELLAIDASNESAVVKRKVYQSPGHGSIADDHSMQSDQPGGGQIAPQPPMFPTQLETGLTEVVSHVQLFESPGNNHAVGVGGNGATTMQQSASAMSASVGGTPQVVPSVVLLPYSTSSSYLPGQMQSPAQQHHQQRHQEQQEEEKRQYQQHDELVQLQAAIAGNSAAAQSKRGNAGNDGAATLAGSATPANIVLVNNARIATSSAFHQSGLNVSCRVHGSSSGAIAVDNDVASKVSAAQCTCFRIAGAGNYVAIIPANEPLALAETGFDADDDTMLYAEDTEGVWQPSSSVQIEKVASETGEVIWRVPRLVRRYPTWDAFHKYLDAYSAATFQLYRVRTTYSVKSRNTRLRQLAASRGLAVREGRNGDPRETEQEGVHGLSRAHLVPEQYEWYSKTFLCTHGWKRRSRGSGQRVSHNVRATECPAKVCATLQRIDGATAWSVVVTKHLTEHNHEISEAIYQQYSEVRRVKDPEVLAQAEQLWRGGATRRRVFEFLKERSPNRVILMKDVHNLVQRWQSQERRPRQDHQQDDEDDEQERPSENSPVVVSASHGDESTPWL
ncbi:hypothetical protein PRIC1_003786 [Phytophthora ramorum]